MEFTHLARLAIYQVPEIFLSHLPHTRIARMYYHTRKAGDLLKKKKGLHPYMANTLPNESLSSTIYGVLTITNN